MSSTHDTSTMLRVLIRNRGVRAVFQPIVDLDDGMIVAYEALCRPAPGHGFHNADEMFRAADECNLGWELEEVTRAAALDAAACWPRDVRLFLNTSPSVFADARFAGALDRLASHAAVYPAQIVLEITERSATDFDDRLLQRVAQAKDHGFHVAVDDAGAGTSGLNRLTQIRPHWIKLDRHLITGIDRDPLKQNLVRSFVHFARMSGVNVIGEGVETAGELGALMGIGVRFAQGYFLARPGERDTTLDPATLAAVRERWASVETLIPADPYSLAMARLSKPALVIDSATIPVREAAARLRLNPDEPGLVLTEGRRLIGWADRKAVLEAAEQAPATPIATLARAAVCSLSPEATLQEALRFACTREDEDMAQPIIVGSGPDIAGIVPLRDLLRAAAAEGRGARDTAGALPARARADEQMQRMLSLSREPAAGRDPDYHADAAFIDVRRFADFNTVFGYPTGDRLVRSLAEQINATVVRGSDGVFLAHLGDDRFVLTARSGLLEPRLRMLMQTFAGRTAAAHETGPSLGLRVLLLPGVFEHASHPRQVYRIEQQLRQKARSQEQNLPTGESILVMDERVPAAAVRMSA